MGALTVNSFLGLNPEIAGKLGGVVYSAPCFGFYNKISALMRLFYSVMQRVANDFIILGNPPY